MWGTPLPITHIYWEKVCHNILKKINHFVWRHEGFSLNHFWTLTLVRQRPMKSLLSICMSVCPSVCTSLTFLKIGSLVYSHIVHDDSWPWHLVTDRARFLKKKLAAWIWAKWPKPVPKLDFLSFSHVCFISFPWNCIQWQVAAMSNI